jgi:hypothetical protein
MEHTAFYSEEDGEYRHLWLRDGVYVALRLPDREPSEQVVRDVESAFNHRMELCQKIPKTSS